MPVSFARLLSNLMLVACLAMPGGAYAHSGNHAGEAEREAPAGVDPMPCHDTAVQADPGPPPTPPCDDGCCTEPDCTMPSCATAACLASVAKGIGNMPRADIAISWSGPIPPDTAPDDPLRPPIG